MSKHSKTAEESKFNGTILGKGSDALNKVAVEGGEVSSVQEWSRVLLAPPVLSRPQSPASNADSRPPSSGLSSVGDRLGDERDSMELS
jgi:transcription initiation factor TFIID subunit 3